MKVGGKLISFLQYISKCMSDFPHMNDSCLVIKLDSREKSVFSVTSRGKEKKNRNKTKTTFIIFLLLNTPFVMYGNYEVSETEPPFVDNLQVPPFQETAHFRFAG